MQFPRRMQFPKLRGLVCYVSRESRLPRGSRAPDVTSAAGPLFYGCRARLRRGPAGSQTRRGAPFLELLGLRELALERPPTCGGKARGELELELELEELEELDGSGRVSLTRRRPRRAERARPA